MWIFVKDGYFSVVKDKYCSEGELMIRARVIKDLERLLDKLGSDADILVFKHADYRYRVKVTADQWSRYLAREAAGVDYANIKDTITWHEPGRSKAYYGCWEALYQWQEGNATFNHLGDE